MSRHGGLEITLADRVGHELDAYWSVSGEPTVQEWGKLELGGGEPKRVATVTIPPEGWIAEHVRIPKKLRQRTVFVQAVCRTCAELSSDPPPTSERQSVHVLF